MLTILNHISNHKRLFLNRGRQAGGDLSGGMASSPADHTLRCLPSYTLNHQPYTLNHQPYTLNHQPYTLNPKP